MSLSSFPMRCPLLSIIAVCIASASAQSQSTDSTAAGKSVWQGVYTEAQAARGDTEHQNNCTTCHGTEKYAGDAFVTAWVGRTAFDLFDQLKTTMPEDNPGGLSNPRSLRLATAAFTASFSSSSFSARS